jgi:hypothetical protein
MGFDRVNGTDYIFAKIKNLMPQVSHRSNLHFHSYPYILNGNHSTLIISFKDTHHSMNLMNITVDGASFPTEKTSRKTDRAPLSTLDFNIPSAPRQDEKLVSTNLQNSTDPQQNLSRRKLF